MSFILDALKKSENARQRQAGPSLFEVKVAAPRRSLPVWALGLGVLLLVYAAALSWFLLRSRAEPDSAPVQRVPPAASASAPAAAPPAATQASAGGAPSRPVPPPQAANAAAAVSSNTAATAAEDGNPADFAPAIQPPAQSSPGTQATPANLPRYRDLASAPGSSLPSLHLDLHVYDPDPGKRYVMINMHTLRQGDSLPDGVQVISIRPDGAVLSYQGRQFLLAR